MAPSRRSVMISAMKIATVVVIAVGLSVAVGALAFHFEVAARARAYAQVRTLRTQTATDLDQHRISVAEANSIDDLLGAARVEIAEDNVRGAQRAMRTIRAELAAPHARAA